MSPASSLQRLHRRARRPAAVPCAIAAALLVAGCGSDSSVETNVKPSYVRGTPNAVSYDGAGDDLLTAGLGSSGLASATAPAVSATPTVAELRRLAIWTNYRAIVDTTAGGGYGTLYGPGVGVAGGGDGKIAGREIIGVSDDGTGRRNVLLMVQIPSTFDPAAPCMITATSSGSRGIYGAVAVGEWGLKRGCAVAYTDKGTGPGPHDLQNDTVARLDGTRTTAVAAGIDAHFNAGLSAADLAAYNAATPNRFAFKHAHSQQNPERDWGLHTLQSVDFAFWVLNELYANVDGNGNRERRIKPSNTIVIASSLSNGGGAALAAAEQDAGGLIDGVAVGEPMIQMPDNAGVTVQRGSTVYPSVGRTLYDYTSYANVFQSCASLSPQIASGPYAATYTAALGALATKRCASLQAKGLLSAAATTTAAQADEALAKLLAYGWEPEAQPLHPSHAAFEVAPSVTTTYANAYSRASVKDRLCSVSFGATTAAGAPTALAPAALATSWATANGVPPTVGIQLINDASVGGPARQLLSVSPSTGQQDMDVDGALCLRGLADGSDARAAALRTGLGEVRRTARLGGRPAMIVHGRSDALVLPTHSSRPYAALNKSLEGSASRLSYVEVTNAQHFDAFIAVPALGYDARFVPMHLYLNRALDAVWANLKNGTALPPSQVVRTTPRGGTPGSAPAIAAANVPAIAATPASGDAITFNGPTIRIPD